MKKVERLPLPTLATLLVGLGVFPGCQSDASDGVETDTETNWLSSCTEDAECGEYSCECGVCTTRCDRTSDCAMAGAMCSRAGEGEHDALCGEATGSVGLCLEEDSSPTNDDAVPAPEPADDDAPSEGAAGGPSSPEPGPAEPEPAPAELEPSMLPEPEPSGPTGDPDADGGSNPVLDAGSGRDAGTPPLVSEDAGPTENACTAIDRAALLGGCCFDESDCEGADVCYQAQCEGEMPAPGRCAEPPPGYCFDDRDCATNERCNGGFLAQCGSLAPDGLGACESANGELLQGYVLWDRAAGAAGTGPALELLEDGSLRLWQQTTPFEPRATSNWDFEAELSPERVDELVRLLLAVDHAALPHDVPFLECYPGLYFEGPDGTLVDMDYGGADALLPEMQGVYDWFDALLLDLAPDFVGPSGYCPALP